MARFGSVIQECYVRKFRANAEVRKERLAALRTPEDVYAYIAEIQAKLKKAWSFPKTKCPLDVRILAKIRRKGYTIEKLIYFSRPGFPVTALLYVPDNAEKGKTPAVIHLLGHAPDGKLCDSYQHVSSSLCQMGAMVLVADPVCQGERFSFPGYPDKQVVNGHNLLNRRLLALGDNIGAWRIWDAVRGIDLLLSRPETDPRRVGVVGNSGGGTMTTLVNAVEPRLTAAAPNCYITTWRGLVENELPVDGEQIPAGVGADGGEMADLLIARAPNPLLIMGEKNDFFDIRGTREAYEEIKRIYTILGVPERVRLFVGPVSHGFNPDARMAAYEFFHDTFKLKAVKKEPECVLGTPAEFNCSPTGNIVDMPEFTTPDAIIRRMAREVVAARKPLSKAVLKRELKKMLHIPAEIGIPSYRVLRNQYINENDPWYGKKVVVDSRFGIETEPFLPLTLHLISDSWHGQIEPCEEAELYIAHQDSWKELQNRAFKRQSAWLYGFDWRGIGESMPDGCDQYGHEFFQLYKFDYHYDAMSRLIGESFLGDRVLDILKTIRLLKAQGVKKITLSGSGIGLVPAVLAAFLTGEKVKTAFPCQAKSWLESSLAPFEQLPQSLIPAGILKLTDLDELQRMVEEENK